SGVTPLHRAVRTRCAAAVRALLDGGADPRRKNKNGSTPIKLATQHTGRGGAARPTQRHSKQRFCVCLNSMGRAFDTRGGPAGFLGQCQARGEAHAVASLPQMGGRSLSEYVGECPSSTFGATMTPADLSRAIIAFVVTPNRTSTEKKQNCDKL